MTEEFTPPGEGWIEGQAPFSNWGRYEEVVLRTPAEVEKVWYTTTWYREKGPGHQIADE